MSEIHDQIGRAAEELDPEGVYVILVSDEGQIEMCSNAGAKQLEVFIMALTLAKEEQEEFPAHMRN